VLEKPFRGAELLSVVGSALGSDRT